MVIDNDLFIIGGLRVPSANRGWVGILKPSSPSPHLPLLCTLPSTPPALFSSIRVNTNADRDLFGIPLSLTASSLARVRILSNSACLLNVLPLVSSSGRFHPLTLACPRQVQKYDIANDRWTTKKIPWDVDGSMSAAAIGANIYACGGVLGESTSAKQKDTCGTKNELRKFSCY